jgi:hypothetical protein
MSSPTLKPQEIPFDDEQSHYRFEPSAAKPFVATTAAIDAYGPVILPCLAHLQALAIRHKGLDYLQVFEDPSKPEPLWFIDDGEGEGGAITALLPSDY